MVRTKGPSPLIASGGGPFVVPAAERAPAVVHAGVSARAGDRNCSLAHTGHVRNPKVTVVLGGVLIVAAMVGATVVWVNDVPGWLTTVLLLVALVTALTGWLMTFRDLTPPRRRR